MLVGAGPAACAPAVSSSMRSQAARHATKAAMRNFSLAWCSPASLVMVLVGSGPKPCPWSPSPVPGMPCIRSPKPLLLQSALGTQDSGSRAEPDNTLPASPSQASPAGSATIQLGTTCPSSFPRTGQLSRSALHRPVVCPGGAPPVRCGPGAFGWPSGGQPRQGTRHSSAGAGPCLTVSWGVQDLGGFRGAGAG